MPRMIIIVDATIVIVVTGVTWGVGCQMVANVLSLTLCSISTKRERESIKE